MIELLKNDMLWFPSAIGVALAVAAIQLVRHRRLGVDRRATVTRMLNTFYGCVIGTMGTGHIVAVTIRALDGTLSDGLRWFLYPLGIILAVPGWLLVASSAPRRLTLLNAWLAIALIAQGPSAPLAVPAILNLIQLRSANRRVERAIVAASALLYSTLLAVGLTYLLTGRRF